MILYKKKLRPFKSTEHINVKVYGTYRGFRYSSVISDLLDMAIRSKGELL